MNDGGAKPSGPRLGPRWLAPLVLVLGVAGVYSFALDNEFIYDDHKIIVSHDGARSFGDVVQIFKERHFPRFPYYRPITRTTLLLQKAVWGNEPAPFHLFNALLMSLMALATYRLLRRPQWKVPRTGALLAATAFAVHPMSSCVVYPICSGRETLLPSLILVLATTAWMTPGRRSHLTAIALLIAALFCKEAAIVFPGLLLLADWLGISGDGRPNSGRAWASRHLPIWAICAGYLWLRHALFGGSQYTLVLLDHPTGPLESCAYALQVVLVPFVALVYEPTVEVWISWWRLPVALAGGALIVTGGWRSGRPGRTVLCFWLAWFLFFTLPTGNILRQEAPFAERYVFLAALPVFAITAAWFSSEHWRAGVRRIAAASSAALILAFSAISISRAIPYHDDVAFAEQWVRTNPEAFEAHYSLGTEALKEGRPEEARSHLGRAIEIRPDFAQAHLDVARASKALGDTTQALDSVTRALTLMPDDFLIAHSGGNLLLDLGRPREAMPSLRTAVRLEPASPEAHNTLGRGLCMNQQIEEGLAEFQRAVQLEPGLTAARYNLAVTLAMLERPEESIPHFQQVLREDPGNHGAHERLAHVLWRTDRLAPALQSARRSLRGPRDVQGLLLVGRIQRDLGEDAEAARTLAQALQTRATHALRRELAWLLATSEDAAVADGPRARQLAEVALQGRQGTAEWDVHAAACARAGDFATAAGSARKALAEAPAEGIPTAGLADRLARIDRGEAIPSTKCHERVLIP